MQAGVQPVITEYQMPQQLLQRAVVAQKTNHLLAGWPAGERQAMEADLEPVELRQGTVLFQAGSTLQHVYFPTTVIVSLVSAMQDGASAEVAMVGNEGLVGVCAFMGGGGALSDAVVQTTGYGWRMRASAFARHSSACAAVMLPLLRYTQALFTQLAQTSACHRHHSLDQQLCCWLLQHQDRHDGNDLLVTHERMAAMLGVRRETVTAGALKLQQAGLISYTRGCVSVLDRKGLQARSCECYAVVSKAFSRLLESHREGKPALHLATPHRPATAHANTAGYPSAHAGNYTSHHTAPWGAPLRHSNA